MTFLEAIEQRHAVRAFLDKPIEGETLTTLQKAVADGNAESGLHIQLMVNEPEAFQANKTSYGAFKNCKNYFALIGPKGKDEAIGYYGEKLVLLAQALGLNTCWVALTYKKGKADIRIESGEKLYMVIALGYGETQGVTHKVKAAEAVSNLDAGSPEWFRAGVRAAILAPTAMNQQKFRLELTGNTVKAKAGMGFYTKVDLGIVKYHFELAAGTLNFTWTE